METTHVHHTVREEAAGPSVSWGGIFCGSFMVLGLQFLFTLLGSAIGFSAFNLQSNPSEGMAIGAGIYLFVTMLISFFFGGYVAMRFAGSGFRVNSVLHGVTVWAIITALTAFAFGSSIRGLVVGGMNMAGQVAPNIDVTITGPTNTPSHPLQQLTPEQKQAIQQKARQAAGTVRKAAAGGSWYLFITFFFGLVAAALGGKFGGSYFYRKTPRGAAGEL